MQTFQNPKIAHSAQLLKINIDSLKFKLQKWIQKYLYYKRLAYAQNNLLFPWVASSHLDRGANSGPFA
jgi:hypothetical protein